MGCGLNWLKMVSMASNCKCMILIARRHFGSLSDFFFQILMSD